MQCASEQRRPPSFPLGITPSLNALALGHSPVRQHTSRRRATPGSVRAHSLTPMISTLSFSALSSRHLFLLFLLLRTQTTHEQATRTHTHTHISLRLKQAPSLLSRESSCR